MMNEIRQLREMLNSESFWEEENCRAHRWNMTNSVSLMIEQELEGYLWLAVWADGSTEASSRHFNTITRAKANLRKAVVRRRKKLVHEATSPAKVEMIPT